MRRTVRSIPVLGTALRSILIFSHRKKAMVESAYRDFVDERLRAARDSAVVSAGVSLSDGARRLLLFPYRRERIDSPQPLVVGGHRFDVADDLVRFTSLPAETVNTLLSRRIENFRTEWLQTPTALRSDGWFYLTTRTYLFANAVHFHEMRSVLDELAELLPTGGRVLDFGGGTGNLALALAALGFQVDYRELSALQKDFTRFRLQRYGFQEHVTILDHWEDLPVARYDAVCALDVLEHLPDLPSVLDELAASLVEGGLLIDTPTFAVGLANPMHHEDPGLESLLLARGVSLDRNLGSLRVWIRRPD